jgi:hypothetical protein
MNENFNENNIQNTETEPQSAAPQYVPANQQYAAPQTAPQQPVYQPQQPVYQPQQQYYQAPPQQQYYQPQYAQPQYNQQQYNYGYQQQVNIAEYNKNYQMVDEAFSKGLAAAIMCGFPVASIIAIVFGSRSLDLVEKLRRHAAANGFKPSGRNIAAKVLGMVGKIVGIVATVIYGIYMFAFTVALMSAPY